MTHKRSQIMALVVMLLLPALVHAQDRPKAASDILDGAGMFSNEAIRTAKEAMARLERTYKTPITIETVSSLRGQGVDEVALRHAEQLNHQGIFILIADKEHKIEVLASPKALREQLGKDRLGTIRDAILEEFRKKMIDDGLTKGIQASASALAAVQPSAAVSVKEGATSALIVRQQVRLTLAGARKAMAGAEAKAAQEGWKMNITVVDDGGHMLAFARMDGARPASITTATAKAISAATYRMATGSPGGKGGAEVSVSDSGSGGKVVAMTGGVPIVVDGQVIGAIGVAGGVNEQDAEAAQAGVAAFLAALKEGSFTEDAKPKPSEGEGFFK